jgi:hypothetical protein
MEFEVQNGGGSLFGSTEELMAFGEIFGGTLAVAFALFAFRHFTKGLPSPGSISFDWTVLALGLWCFCGMAIDGWAHKHGAVDDSFFTPWHAVWYAGFNAYAAFITFSLWRLYDGPLPITPSAIKAFLAGMPRGYGPSVAGMVVFGVAGVGDLLWHTFLGIEGGTDILLSTTHLGLAAGLSLSLMAPFWAAWNTPGSGEKGLVSQLPVLFGIGTAWSVLTLFTSYVHHQTLSYNSLCNALPSCAAGNAGLELGISAILLQSVLLTGVVLLFMRRWSPVFGTFTVLLGVNGIAIAAFAPGEPSEAWQHMVTPLAAGLALDVAYRLVDPFGSGRIRTFAFLVPAIHTFVWLAVLTYNTGWQVGMVGGNLLMTPLGWSVHATIGAVFLAGFVGVLVSIGMIPPATPDGSEAQETLFDDLADDSI